MRVVKDSQLRDIVGICYPCTSRDFGGILLVLGELRVNFFSYLREWLLGVPCPEEVLRVEVKLSLGVLIICRNDNAIQLELQAIRYQSLVCPSMGHG